MPVPAHGEVQRVEQWFVAHGLPYFVDHVRATVQARLAPGRVASVAVLAALLGAAVGTAVALLTGVGSLGVPTAASVALGVVAVYALRALRAQTIAAWALRRALGSLGLLFPLLTRALPMLLLFVTFLFINAEVWQVSATLDGGVLWGTVLFFGAAAVLFLVPRLADELDAFDDSIEERDLVEASRGTPLEAYAQQLVADDIDLPEEAQVGGLQMVNLVLVLLIAQAVQVLLLAVAVFGFFIVFGLVAIDRDVIAAWTTTEPAALVDAGPVYLSIELVQVSVFLAAFSGLYFTVYAVTDELYRKEFFTEIMAELRRAVGARVVYRALRRDTDRPA